MEKFLYPILIIALIILVIFISRYFSKGNRKGRAAEKKVAQHIKDIMTGKKYKLINNAKLPLYDKKTEIDHILIADFGIAVIETKGISGSVSGSGKTLEHKIGSKIHKFYNPVYQNKTHSDNIIHHLKKGNLNNIPVYSFVVFSAPDIKLNTNCGIYLSQLEKELKKLPKSKCDIKKIYSYIKSL